MNLEFIQQNLYLVAIAAISGGMLVFTALRRPGGGAQVNTAQATQLINREDALLVDVREPAEYAAGHLPASRNIPLATLGERATELEKFKGKPVIIVCQSGARSPGAGTQLKKLGFEKVYNLEGGIVAWGDAGLPISRKGAK